MKHKMILRACIFTLVTILLMALMLIFEKRNALISGILTICIVVNTIVYICYIIVKNRCPHCGCFIRYFRGDYCPHCGNKLE